MANSTQASLLSQLPGARTVKHALNALKKITFTSLCCGIALALAACSSGDETEQKVQVPPPPTTKHATKLPPNPGYCPGIHSLQRKKNLTWSAPNGWVSQTASFSTQITTFLGAQWQGLSNGTVLCIYRGDHGDFSISLHNDQFVEAPWGAAWQDLHLKKPDPHDVVQKATYVINCVSTSPKDCPFPSQSKVWKGPSEVNPASNQLYSKPLSN